MVRNIIGIEGRLSPELGGGILLKRGAVVPQQLGPMCPVAFDLGANGEIRLMGTAVLGYASVGCPACAEALALQKRRRLSVLTSGDTEGFCNISFVHHDQPLVYP